MRNATAYKLSQCKCKKFDIFKALIKGFLKVNIHIQIITIVRYFLEFLHQIP